MRQDKPWAARFAAKAIAARERCRHIARDFFANASDAMLRRTTRWETGMAKVAIVTGAGTGVGRAAALALMKAGFAVTLVGRRKEPLEAVAKEGAGEAFIVPTDVKDVDAIRAMFAKVKEKYGRLDVLFNNAGMGAPPVPFHELPLEKWKEVVDTNLTALFVCTQEAFKIMKDQNPRGGRIINNGSISAHTPRPRSVAYTSTKHAVTGLTKSTALDGREYDIACSQIDIGNAITPMTDRMVSGILQPDGSMKPEPRMDADHVGNAVAYMASLPLDANVLFMTVMATKMPFVGRG
jgi:NAD(P)-dependent dehydrogenase (short-subunit alcohol dehydrogenase family)